MLYPCIHTLAHKFALLTFCELSSIMHCVPVTIFHVFYAFTRVYTSHFHLHFLDSPSLWPRYRCARSWVTYCMVWGSEIDVQCSWTENVPYLFHFVSIFIPCLEPIFYPCRISFPWSYYGASLLSARHVGHVIMALSDAHTHTNTHHSHALCTMLLSSLLG